MTRFPEGQRWYAVPKGARGERFLSLTGPLDPRVVVSPLRGDEYKVSVTEFAFVTPVVHAEEPEPPSPGRSPAEDF